MDNNHLNKAQNDWGHSMDIKLENGRIVLPDGWISDKPEDTKTGKHFGTFKGFSFFSKRKGTKNEIINVINSIAGECQIPCN